MTGEVLTASDGTRLRRRTWHAHGEPKGIVAIAHGYAEYAGRYGGLASRLNAAGYTVESIDARGHGESEGRRVMVRSVDELAEDFGTLCDQVQRDTELPLFLLGHSLGSLVAIQVALRRQTSIAGVVLSGNALDGRSNLPAPAIPLLHLLARLLPNLRLLPALVAEDVSTDPRVVAAYSSDPLVDRGRWRLATGSAVMKAIQHCREVLPALQVPLLVIHGEQDHMLSVAGARFAMQHAGSPDKQLLICPGEFHEPLSGLSRDATETALIAWLDCHVGLAVGEHR